MSSNGKQALGYAILNNINQMRNTDIGSKDYRSLRCGNRCLTEPLTEAQGTCDIFRCIYA